MYWAKLPPMLVLAFDFDLIVDIEAGVSPGEELFDPLLGDPLPKHEDPFLVAGGAKIASLAGEG